MCEQRLAVLGIMPQKLQIQYVKAKKEIFCQVGMMESNQRIFIVTKNYTKINISQINIILCILLGVFYH